MGRLAQVLSFVRSSVGGHRVTDVKSDLGGGDVVTAQHFAPAGDDSMPLSSDYEAIISLVRQRGTAVVGYIDPRSAQTAGAGEKRIYSRDSSGSQVAQVWLKSDGQIVLNNSSGMITMAANGTITLNGVVIDPSGNISAPGNADFAGDVTAASVTADKIEALTSLVAALYELVGHTHPAGTPPGNTGPNNP